MNVARSVGAFSTQKSNTIRDPFVTVLIFLKVGTAVTVSTTGTAFSVTVSVVDDSVVFTCPSASFCVIGSLYTPAFCGAMVAIVYFPEAHSLAVRRDPSIDTESSERPGVASTTSSIGELASTVDEGLIVTA